MRWLWTAILLLALAGCTHLPPLKAVDAGRDGSIAAACRSYFLQGRWQLVHTIQARLAGGRQTIMTGAVVLSAADRSVHCVLMTLEGVVLFDALDDGRLTVTRALGPFANDHFAEGLVADIRFLFLEPDGGVENTGRFAGGDEGCRYRAAGGRTVDVVRRDEGGWLMRQYDSTGRLRRTLHAEAAEPGMPAPHMLLEAGGRNGYRLSMTLVNAEPLP